ncbi:MAG: hypothetical protein UY42_C0002G0026 [Parcubacteria group bacterium GW2011_GWA2_49_16]|nr:MAG: hypothetical protein UY42_C0002G0026 [Parcubacteria group bacterium GW2011_GWA2_49_16]
MTGIIIFAVLSLVCLIAAGALYDPREAKFIVGVIGVGFMAMSLLFAKVHFGTLHSLDGESFIVRAQTLDDAAKKAFVLYDLKDKRNRLAELDKYPPDGYREVKTSEGVTMIIPIPVK